MRSAVWVLIHSVVSLPKFYNYLLNKHFFQMLLVSSSVSRSQHTDCWCKTHKEETIIAGNEPKLMLQLFWFKIQTRQTSSKVNNRKFLVYLYSRIMDPPRVGGGVNSTAWTSGLNGKNSFVHAQPLPWPEDRLTSDLQAWLNNMHAQDYPNTFISDRTIRPPRLRSQRRSDRFVLTWKNTVSTPCS